MVRNVKVVGIAISILKDKYLPQELLSKTEFYALAENKELNPSETVFEDEQKIYFYNDRVVYYYFKNSEGE